MQRGSQPGTATVQGRRATQALFASVLLDASPTAARALTAQAPQRSRFAFFMPPMLRIDRLYTLDSLNCFTRQALSKALQLGHPQLR